MSKCGRFVLDVCCDYGEGMTPQEIAKKYSKKIGSTIQTQEIKMILNNFYDPKMHGKEGS